MTNQRKVLTSGLQDHPAVRAWSKLGFPKVSPAEIVVFKRKDKGAVYGLEGVGPDGQRVIAKLCHRDKGLLERTVYEQVLPGLSVHPIVFFGAVEDEDAVSWLFVEDVGGKRYDADNDLHRTLAACWLADLETHVSRETVSVVFPERGSAFYRNFLESIMSTMPAILRSGVIGHNDPEPLHRIADACAALESSWETIEGFCAAVPTTFAHGDCLAKNVHVRTTPSGPAIAAFDWGGAGWSPAGTDLGQLALPRRGPPDTYPDLDAYGNIVRTVWPELDTDTITRLAHLGQLFWSLKVIGRGLQEFDCKWKSPAHVLADMRVYGHALARSIDVSIGDSVVPA